MDPRFKGAQVGEHLVPLPHQFLRVQGQGPAQGAAAQGGHQGRLGPGQTAAILQFPGDQGRGQGREGQLVAPGHDGGQKVGLPPGGEHQQVPVGRLFQGFQQGVGRGVILDAQGFGGLDEHDPPAAAQGRIVGEAAQFPDLLDLDLGLRPLPG